MLAAEARRVNFANVVPLGGRCLTDGRESDLTDAPYVVAFLPGQKPHMAKDMIAQNKMARESVPDAKQAAVGNLIKCMRTHEEARERDQEGPRGRQQKCYCVA